jgi:hypothetical protein
MYSSKISFIKIIVVLLLSLNSWYFHSQNRRKEITVSTSKDSLKKSNKPENKSLVATFKEYRIITLQRDTTYVDTSLTIKKEYEYNYLRKDIFGLLPFANEGQTYTVLDYGLKNYASFPEIGFSGKHFNFLQASDINYFSVATPITELYFKTVMEQGQSLDALIALNLSERLNISIAYKGLRSLGKYINQLSSAGNFSFTTSYNTLNNRYFFNFHFTGQDILNGENGGITTIDDFEGGETHFPNLNLKLKPRKGDAVAFDTYNLFGQCDNRALHEGLPIHNGVKNICTFWFHR